MGIGLITVARNVLSPTAPRPAVGEGDTQPPIQGPLRSLPSASDGRDVKLTIYSEIMRRLRILGDVPPLPNTYT